MKRALFLLSIILLSPHLLPYIHEYNINQTVSDIRSLNLEPQAEIDYVREYVNSHSYHKTGYQWLTTKTPLMLTLMRLGIKPPMTCGYRNLAMIELLDRLGYQTRTILMYSDNFDTLQGHVYGEVYLNGLWQMQDSDFNYSLPLSTWQVFNQYPELLPEPLPQLTDAFAYDATGRGDVSEIHIIDFDLEKPLDNGLTFPQLIYQFYGFTPSK